MSEFNITAIKVNSQSYKFFNLAKIAQEHGVDISKMPLSIKILLENVARNSTKEDVTKVLSWVENKGNIDAEIQYLPYRVLMQDFTGVPAIVDLAAMRDATQKLGGDVTKINPVAPVHLVIDHSIQVDSYATSGSSQENTDLEIQRNKERYEFLKWGQKSFNNLYVVPPGTGICHQINIEHIAPVVAQGDGILFFDTVVGTDSHTTMVNGLGVLGWGVGGIEAESVMLGQSVSLLVPQVVGFELKGRLNEGITATDLILTITQMLRKKGVVEKFVEFFGEGLSSLTLEDRATIANMAPEYGATCGIFPIDDKTIDYLTLTGRSNEQIEIVREYAKAQGVFGVNNNAEFTDTLTLDLSTVKPCISGPKRPQDRLDLASVASNFDEVFPVDGGSFVKTINESMAASIQNTMIYPDETIVHTANRLDYGSVVIAAITSCTNTSNPSVLIAAGLLAKKAVEKGLKVPSFVKTSLAPGSRVAEKYLAESGLQTHLDALGFNVVGFGCTTCIGNSGPLKPEFEKEISEKNLTVSAVLSGNRNFEGRVHALVKANYLASPPLVVAFALLGNIRKDILTSPIGIDLNGDEVFLKDIWPSNEEIQSIMKQFVTREVFVEKYKNIYEGTKEWQAIKVSKSDVYSWQNASTYIENPPYFEGMKRDASGKIDDIINAKPLLILGDSITTDHISPAGNIAKNSPAAKFLQENSVPIADFNSYGARRGSHSVMMRGTFANIRIKNEMAMENDVLKEGGYSKNFTTGEILPVYDIAMNHKQSGTPMVVIAGKEYGTGSSRDWAAKGTYLLGVKAVIAESFERIHRSNLVGMGVLPFVFDGETRLSLNLKGDEKISIKNLQNLIPAQKVTAEIEYADGTTKEIKLISRVNTNPELDYIKNGGIMHYVIRNTAFSGGNNSGNNLGDSECKNYGEKTRCPLTKFLCVVKSFFWKHFHSDCKSCGK